MSYVLLGVILGVLIHWSFTNYKKAKEIERND